MSLKSIWQELVDPGKDARNQLSSMQNNLAAQNASERNMFIGNANNANAINRSYLNNYLNSMNNASQLSYNQGVSNAYKQAYNNENTIRQNLANRGVTSGVDIKALANNQGNLARTVSQLQAQKYFNDADLAGKRYELTGNENANAYKNLLSAYNYSMPISEADRNRMNQLQAEGQQQGILPQLVGTVANAYLGNWAGALGNAAGMAKTVSNNQSLRNGSNLFPTGEFVDGNVNSYKLSYPTFINQMTPSNTGVSGDYINRYNYIFNRG